VPRLDTRNQAVVTIPKYAPEPEEHVVLNREDHIDRWRTLVPMIPEQFLPPIISRLTDTSRRLELMDPGTDGSR
jgi:hypothetical protein